MPALEDKTLYCARCGISFVWSREEQQAARPEHGAVSAPATFCPGCRRLVPAPGRERGLVRWYSTRRGYGFIARRDGPEIFAHVSEVRAGSRLQAGALVEFAIGETERGPSAQTIEVLEGTAAAA